ncbi:MAG: RecQ family ATP-dependent DNA helicase [Chloroflexota bacterium]
MSKLKITENLELASEHLIHLPPEIRDLLLQFLADWGTPEQQITLVTALREAHGPLLFLLDYQATALSAKGDTAEALEVIERRQRRSTTINSQTIEARALLAAGYEEHAQTVVDDIAQAYPRNIQAIGAAAEVYSQLGRFEHARELLETYLRHRPSDLQGTLLLTCFAHKSNEPQVVTDYIQRLGAGVPVGISVPHLRMLGELHKELKNQESANAIDLELERRQAADLQRLFGALEPIVGSAEGNADDIAKLYRNLSGPESFEVSRKENRNIQLEAVRHFGFMKLRYGQPETIATVLRRESILAVMPTGAGKSLCYQLPALAMPRATLVISPLIALMKDQVESLPSAARAQATFINSTLEEGELDARMSGIANGEYKLIYAAPERLRQRAFLHVLRSAGLDLFVIDEAHCVSLWGHDFRPDYLFIQEARRELGNPTALAMTATAPPAVRDEIVDYMGADDEPSAGQNIKDEENEIHASGRRPKVISLDIFRDNLHMSALRFNSDEEKLTALLKFVSETEGSGIVYVNSRAKSESLAYELRSVGVEAEAYHAGLSERGEVQDRFMADKTRVVVATVAFGMGIDKSDIRFIVHFHPSRSLAAYYQEVGRAGRDGKPSDGVLFYSNNDWANLRRWAKSDEQGVEFLEKVYAAIATQLGVNQAAESANLAMNGNGDSSENGLADQDGVEGTQAALRFESLKLGEPTIGIVDPRRLQQVANTDETTMRVAVSTLERADLLSRSFDQPRELEISLPSKLPAKVREATELVRLLKGLNLRGNQKATFKTEEIAKFMRWPIHETEAALLDWQTEGFLQVKGSRRAMLIELTPPRSNAPQGTPASEMRERLERLLVQSTAIAQRRIDDMVGYATSETCRHGYISAHFGSPPRIKCEKCDNCTGIRPDIPPPAEPTHPLPDDADVEPMLLDCLVSLPKPVGRSGLARILTGSMRAPVTPDKARHHGRLKGMGEAMVMNYVDAMLEDGRLRQYERQGYPVLAATVRGRAEAEVWLGENPELAGFGDAPPPTENATDANTPPDEEKYTALQKALWLWRRRTADTLGQPPYAIMNNETMLQVAETRPSSPEELAVLPGMGAQRVEGYGPQILDLIKLNPLQDGDEELLKGQRLEQNQLEKKIQEKVAGSVSSTGVSAKIERRIYMKMQEFRQKAAVTGRTKSYQVASNTILKAISQNGPTSQEDLDKILGFRTCGLADYSDKIIEFVKAELEKAGQG